MHNIISIIPKCNLMKLQIYVRRCHFNQPLLLAIYCRNKTGHRNVGNLVANLANSKQMMFSTVSEKADESLAILNYDAIPNRDRVVFSRKQQDELKKKGMATWYFKNYVTAMQLYNNNQNTRKINHFRTPEIHYELDTKSNIWSARMTIFHPEEKVFNTLGSKKKDVENQLAFEAVYWLRHRRCLNHALMPIFENKPKIKNFAKATTIPIEIPSLNDSHRSELLQYLDHFETNYSPLLKAGVSNLSDTPYIATDEEHVDLNGITCRPELQFDPVDKNPVTGRIVCDFQENELVRRSLQLSEHLRRRNSLWNAVSKYREFQDRVASLPITASREELLQTISNNQVTVISGQTACGKTTQLPLMIFEQLIAEGRGASASILVTQPRRLPAIAVAEQVAFQFGESKCGHSVGYHVRFEKTLPKYDIGYILFCTTGILLNKLVKNPNLKQISHVIIDEVHERDVTTDLLLIFIRRLIKINCNIKIVLMSATTNAKEISNYFNDAPFINISGRCFPVDIQFLEESATKRRAGNNNLTPAINPIQIAETVEHIDKNADDDGAGSILIFLPGWSEIKQTREALQRISKSTNYLQIIPCHSNLPSSEQKLIFMKPKMGTRKVVLSTNIAETSLTVPDVVYVIDTGLHKKMRYHKQSDVATFGTHFISQANAIQRAGRAGRVAAGKCFRLYTEDQFEQCMDKFPTPEMQCIPLESVVIQTKLYAPTESAVNVIQEALSSPESTVIQRALEAMKACNVLDDSEKLTSLGQRILNFPLHPRLSVSLVAATMFGVLDPVLNIVAVLSAPRSLFDTGIEDRSKLRQIKNMFAGNVRSDHVAFARLIYELEKEYSETDGDIQDFINRNLLHYNSSEAVLLLKRMYRQHVIDAKLIHESDIYDSKSICNRHRDEPALILAAVLVGVYPNVIKKITGKICGTKIVETKDTIIDVRTNHPVKLPTETIARDTYQDDLAKQEFMIYFSGHLSENSNQLIPRDVSVISPLMLLLFAGKVLEKAHQHDLSNIFSDMKLLTTDQMVVKIDNHDDLKFSALEYDLDLLIRWKSLIQHFSAWWTTRDINNPTDLDEDMEKELKKVLDLTLRILSDGTSDEPSDKLG